MLNYFVNKFCKQNDTIVSYCDRRYSEGNVYCQNNFKLVCTNKPNYDYVTPDFLNRINRMSLQKNKLKKLSGITEGTEQQIAAACGFHKIFNCGTHTFVYTVT